MVRQCKRDPRELVLELRDGGPQFRPGLVGEVGISPAVGVLDEVCADNVLNLPPLVFGSSREVAVLRKIRSGKPHDLWVRVLGSVNIAGIEAAANVAAQGEMANALGEGFADGLDVGGF